MTEHWIWLSVVCLAVFGAVWFAVRFGWPEIHALLRREQRRLDRVLNRQLLMDVNPRLAMAGIALLMLFTGFLAYTIGDSWVWAALGFGVSLLLPGLIVNHLETRRREQLDSQLVDAVTTLGSGLRAGLNLVQSMQLLVRNSDPPIRQEFEHLLREFELGVDLNQAMQNASGRIGSSRYRLLFSAVAAHRERGGDVAGSLDRIADSIREIERLEGKLQTLTAQGRNQAWMMAGMAIVIAMIGYLIAPEDMGRVFTEPLGRVLLLVSGGLILVGFLWIRRIMSVNL